MAGRRVDATGRMASVDPGQLQAAHEEVRRVFPAEFTTTDRQNADFLWSAACDSMEREAHRAVLPYLDRIVPAEAPDGDGRGFSRYRRARAVARLLTGDLRGAAADDPRLLVASRDAQLTRRQLDLSAHYNRALGEGGFGVPGQRLGDLTAGPHDFEGVRFDLRGLVSLAGPDRIDRLHPSQAAGIAVGDPVRHLHVLMGTNFEGPDGTPVGRLVLHYADGGTCELPMVYGEDVRNWWTVAGEPAVTRNAKVVWRGTSPLAETYGATLRLYLRRYDNPRPGVEVKSLDIVSAMNRPSPLIAAITTE